MAGTGDKTPEYCHVLRTMMYRFNGHKISEGINQCYLFYSKKDFQSTNLLIFQVLRKAAVVQGISSSEWCLRSQVRYHPVLALYFIFMQYIAGKFRKCEKLPEQGMYLSRSRTGNIFPYRTVVVLRHHVYVPEFHDPSCYSVQSTRLTHQVLYMKIIQ